MQMSIMLGGGVDVKGFGNNTNIHFKFHIYLPKEIFIFLKGNLALMLGGLLFSSEGGPKFTKSRHQ